ncbi:hypothetical protein [Lactiplantibacillus plantarum]|uniref:hypothetical protein n=1 Tax=Lactiplantibacillus plantarum TaxID=1590 RepID=UPI0002BDBB90|nr:hypothetical protein [Lactiplantibacillus plantarum]EMP43540.1 hypothetical protein H073_11047 [Lactiplantibacillus plantarum UCMA 3037]
MKNFFKKLFLFLFTEIFAVSFGYIFLRLYFQDVVLKDAEKYIFATTALSIVFGIKLIYSLRIYLRTNSSKKTEFLKQEVDLLINALYFITNITILSSLFITAHLIEKKHIPKHIRKVTYKISTYAGDKKTTEVLNGIYTNSTYKGVLVGISVAIIIVVIAMIEYKKSEKREKRMEIKDRTYIYIKNLNSKK